MNYPELNPTVFGLRTNQSDRLNHVIVAAYQYLSRSHVTD